jgi:hypothetical protein
MRTLLERSGVVDYQVERHNEAWADHQARTLVTGALIAWLKPDSVIDPACGDGSIVVAADRANSIKSVLFGDLSAPNITYLESSQRRHGWEFGVATIADTIGAYPGPADVVVLTEVLEHLPDPDVVLRLSRFAGRYLVVSSPVMRPGQVDTNPEHLWQFDRQGYQEMLEGAGWAVQQYTFLHFKSEYDFGIWICS